MITLCSVDFQTPFMKTAYVKYVYLMYFNFFFNLIYFFNYFVPYIFLPGELE